MPMGNSPEPPVTRSGAYKKRFTDKERFQLLDMGPADLRSFMRIFAPRESPYIIQTAVGVKSEWRTVHHRLSPRTVLRHLAGELWVGTRAWPTTKFACIDVDRHGCSDREFEERRSEAESCLRRLNINPKRCLVVPTPGAGLHLYVFFARAISTDSLPNIFRCAGLQMERGRHEIYPSQTQGLRLPFGYCPFEQANPRACIRFLQVFARKWITRHDPLRFQQDARRIQLQRARSQRIRAAPGSTATGRTEAREGKPGEPISQEAVCKIQTTMVGVPKAERMLIVPRVDSATLAQACIQGGNGHSASARFHTLLAKRTWSREDALQLESLDIPGPGYRLEVTKRLAWHFVHVLSLRPEEAVERLVSYSYSRGARSSRDVRADLQRGTRQVERQIIELIDWMESETRPLAKDQPRHETIELFGDSEIEHFVQSLHQTPCDLVAERASFLLRWLAFAKTCGRAVPGGWEAAPSIIAVIRKWPHCSGMRYKKFMDWALTYRILWLVREKVQFVDGRPGRARTYVMPVPCRDEPAHYSLGEALELMKERVLAFAGRRNVLNSSGLWGVTGNGYGSGFRQKDPKKERHKKTIAPGDVGKAIQVEGVGCSSLDPAGGIRTQPDRPAIPCIVDQLCPAFLEDPLCPDELRRLTRSHGEEFQTKLEEDYQVFCFQAWMSNGHTWTRRLSEYLQLSSFLEYANLVGLNNLLRTMRRDPLIRCVESDSR